MVCGTCAHSWFLRQAPQPQRQDSDAKASSPLPRRRGAAEPVMGVVLRTRSRWSQTGSERSRHLDVALARAGCHALRKSSGVRMLFPPRRSILFGPQPACLLPTVSSWELFARLLPPTVSTVVSGAWVGKGRFSLGE